jgi:Ni/Fe-hydrogenase subunit HybB-like protein
MKLNLTIQPRFRLNFSPLVWVLLTLMGIAFVIAMIRYIFGIGAISDLSYSYPWGFWISFDLFTGVVISSGGFLMAGTVYILRIKEFEPLLRPSVLTAFLGYIMVAIALLVDLGHPERIWYMMIHWNHTSVLLEIGICVMSYLTVLAIEFAPVIFEGLKWQKFAHFLHHAVRYPWCSALHFASILPRLAIAHSTHQTASALVDSHPSGHVFRLRHLCWHRDDYLRVFTQFALLPTRA